MSTPPRIVVSRLCLLLAATPLGACKDDGKLPEDTGPAAEIPLAPPRLGVMVPTSPGTLNTTCTLTLTTTEVDTAATETATLNFTGGEVGTVALVPEVLYSAVVTHEECTRSDDGGEFASGTFSGDPGSFFVFWYTGVSGAFETLVQEVDFHGGVAWASFSEGTVEADVEAAATTVGAVVDSVDPADPLRWKLTFPYETPVGDVLYALETASPAFEGGDPEWYRTPNWW